MFVHLLRVLLDYGFRNLIGNVMRKGVITPENKLLVPRRKFISGGVAALSAARVLSTPAFARPIHGGVATSSVQIPPAQAAAVGYTNLTFFDDFDSIGTIDVSDTQAPGFNWYPHNAWPGSNAGSWPNSGGARQLARHLKTTPSRYYSVANSVLTASGSVKPTDDTIDFQSFLSTACVNPKDHGKWVGNGFINGWYAEVEMACALPVINPIGQFENVPAFWCRGLESLTDVSLTGSWFSEIDIIEKSWLTPGGEDFVAWRLNAQHSELNIGSNNLNVADSTLFNTWGCLNVPMAQNGGTGLVKWYCNNVNLSALNVTYTATGASTPGTNGPNVPGTYSEIDHQHMVFQLNWSVEPQSIQVRKVRIWQL